jgi:serine---pyruvate transaminase
VKISRSAPRIGDRSLDWLIVPALKIDAKGLMNKPRLMTPGPSPVPEDVLLELARPVIHHRSDEAREVLVEVIDGLKYVFQTQNDVLILTSSGTGSMEAAVVNTCPAGSKAIVLDAGWFASRWGVLCKTYGVEPIVVATEWGRPVDPSTVATALKEHPDAVAVFGTLSETSTGTGHPVEAIGRVVAETSAIFVVDGISGVGAMECRTDEWKIDILCVGSQKALMIPPGLAFLAVSPKSWAKIDAFESPSYYFNLKLARKSMKSFDTPFTPAHTLIGGLKVALGRIRAEGIENVWARHRRMSDACQAGILALGLERFSTRPAEGLTVFRIPKGLKDASIRAGLSERFGITTIGGQDRLKGQILRIGHMGYMDELDVVAGLAALEMVLADLDYEVEPGIAVSAAQRVLISRK